MSLKKIPERKNTLHKSAGNEAVVLSSSASGRTVGFLVAIGRRGIPFGRTADRRYGLNENILDTLMDGSFLPYDIDAITESESMELSDKFYSLENRLRCSLQAKDLSSRHLSELTFLMQHIHMTEN